MRVIGSVEEGPAVIEPWDRCEGSADDGDDDDWTI
jgi:hypothetical protein